MMSEILRVENLTKKFKKKNLFSSDSDEITAADNVSFLVNRGEILAIAGQSGSCLLYTSPSPRDKRGYRMQS